MHRTINQMEVSSQYSIHYIPAKTGTGGDGEEAVDRKRDSGRRKGGSQGS